MRALFVDDDVDVLEGIMDGVNFNAIGIDDVLLSHNASHARGLMTDNEVDILVTDIEMPAESGISLLEWVRDSDMETVTLFYTGYANFSYAQKAISLQSLDYLLKPVAYGVLQEHLQRAVQYAVKNKGNKSYRSSPRTHGRAVSKAVGFGFGNDQPGTRAENQTRSVCGDVKHYIKTHLGEDINRQSIAQKVYLNADYLARVFKREAGVSLGEYIQEQRLNEAKRLLSQTAVPVYEIAVSVGYDNFSYFCQLFKKHTGLSPNKYRSRNARR